MKSHSLTPHTSFRVTFNQDVSKRKKALSCKEGEGRG